MPSTRTAQPGPRKSALRVASLPTGTVPLQGHAGLAQVPAHRTGLGTLTAAQLREISIDEFAAWLRTQTRPKTKRPYEEKTVRLYCSAAKALDAWMTAEKVDADFAACDLSGPTRRASRTARDSAAPAHAWSNPLGSGNEVRRNGRRQPNRCRDVALRAS
jgi:hypothetical protein